MERWLLKFISNNLQNLALREQYKQKRDLETSSGDSIPVSKITRCYHPTHATMFPQISFALSTC
jgi:hypothetical protein